MSVHQDRLENGDEALSSLEQKLRSAGKIPLEDRPLMAEHLGQIAVELNPQKPLHAIRQMWGTAWGDDQSFDKRKRLVRLPGETGPAEYEAAAPKWCKLIRAAAELLNLCNWNETSDDKYGQVFRRVLRGTSFWPHNALSLQPGMSLAQELLDMLNRTILSSIRQGTGLLELWADTARGGVQVVIDHFDDSKDLPPANSAVEAAAQRASELPCVSMSGASAARFSVERGAWPDWKFPRVELGALVQKVTVPVFVLPDEVAQHHDGWGLDGLQWGADDEFYQDGGAVGEWLRSELTGRSIDFDEFCQSEWRDLGYGWREKRAYKIHRLTLSLEPRANGEPVLWLRAYDTDELVPEAISPDETYKRLLSGSRQSEFRGSLSLDLNWEQLGWMYSPADEPDTPPRFLGFAETNQARTLESHGWLKSWFNGELSDDLLCYAHDVSFIPAISVQDDFPAAYPPDTPLGALLLNAVGPHETRVSRLLLEQAKKIVELGNGYLIALADNYRSAMMS